MRPPLAVGISTCPNDTYAFAGLLTGAVPAHATFELGDIQALNESFAAGRLDVAKVSFSAVLDRDVRILDVGAAVGFGVGPVLLAPRAIELAELQGRSPRVLAPGRDTTAALLLEIFHPELAPVEHVVFHQIMPALRAGQADLGVCIHEGRFTWRAAGLALVEDLGQRWERETGLPLPLGGLAAAPRVPEPELNRLAAAVRSSLAWAADHPERALEVMRAHAQEHVDEVLWRHVELYVTAETQALSERGRRALDALAQRVRSRPGSNARGEARVLEGPS